MNERNCMPCSPVASFAFRIVTLEPRSSAEHRSGSAARVPLRGRRAITADFARHLSSSDSAHESLDSIPFVLRYGEPHLRALDAAIAQHDFPAVARHLSLEMLERLRELDLQLRSIRADESTAPGALDRGGYDPQMHHGGPAADDVVFLLRFDFDGAIGLPIAEVEVVRDDARARAQFPE